MIYLDNAATTLTKPNVVIDAVVGALNHFGNSGRGIHQDSLKSSVVIHETRKKLQKLFNGEQSKQIIFTSGATESLNLVIKGLHVAGDHVIVTMMEHNSVLRPLYELEEAGIIELTILLINELGNLDYSNIQKAMKPNTKSIIISHASNITGNVVDLEKVGKIAKENDVLFIVDASQSAGTLSIDVKKQKIDILCFTGHKSLFGPQGTGGLYLKEDIPIQPLKVGGTGIDTYNKHHPLALPSALEAGTLNGHGIAGLGAGVGFILDETIQKIHKKEMDLMNLFYSEMKKIPVIKIYGDFTTMNRCPIVSLNVGSIDSAEISDKLSYEYGIATRSGGHCGPLMHQALGTVNQGVVRFSFSYFNTEKEVLETVQAMKDIVNDIGG